MFTAIMRFTQGATVGTAGRSLRTTSHALVRAQSVGDETGATTFTFRMLDAPPGSALAPPEPATPLVLYQGPLNYVDFDPDLAGSYRVEMTVSNNTVSVGTIKTFSYRRRRGWTLPAFLSSADENDFEGQKRGYTELYEEVFDDVLDNAFFLDEAQGASDGEALVWSAGDGRWVPGEAVGGGGDGTLTKDFVLSGILDSDAVGLKLDPSWRAPSSFTLSRVDLTRDTAGVTGTTLVALHLWRDGVDEEIATVSVEYTDGNYAHNVFIPESTIEIFEDDFLWFEVGSVEGSGDPPVGPEGIRASFTLTPVAPS